MTEKMAILKVQGMHCEGCANTVGKALNSLKGVKEAKVDLDKKRAVVTFDSQEVNEEKLKKVIVNAGFEVQ